MNTDKKTGNVLRITWQRLVTDRGTCPRCGSTEKEFDRAVSVLSQALVHIGIEVVAAKEELSAEEFRKDPLHSNRIWMNDRLLDDWIGGKTGQSPCCDVCGPSECRTITLKGLAYEVIPAEMIIKAGLAAASQMVSNDTLTDMKIGRDRQ